MERIAYEEMADAEDEHWWFVGRRSIIADIFDRLELPRSAEILEVGAGTGGNLRLLSNYGHVRAMEPNETARQIAIEKSRSSGAAIDPVDIAFGRCPDSIPFQQNTFDLICMFDVLEHVVQDSQTLAVLLDRLRPGGRLLITVPAYQWLWSSHDEHLHHFRRYTKTQLNAIAAAVGMRVDRLTYFNTFLLPAVAAIRLGGQLVGREGSQGMTATKFSMVNGALRKLLAAERYLLRGVNLPMGVSLLGVFSAWASETSD